MGVVFPNVFTSSSGIDIGISGVQTGPGATALTRIPLSASNCAKPPVKFWIAPFVVA